MHAEELRMAVAKIVGILEKSDIRSVVNQYRSAKGDNRTAAAARLGHCGALIMEKIDALSPAERQVTRLLHLDSLGTTEYWQDLLGSVNEPKRHLAGIVHLASRVMFACNHLPSVTNLLGSVETLAVPVNSDQGFVPGAGTGEGSVSIRLTDAGERASDPDRLARAIDGIDMLYSACASIARKPAVDLRMDGISAKKNGDRDLHFTGERDSLAAVSAVIDSIPEALAEIGPEDDIDLDAIIQSLPIFDDLNTLASLGTFSKKDLKDISDTMHQGSLLTLESGVILLAAGRSEGSRAASANDASSQGREPAQQYNAGGMQQEPAGYQQQPSASQVAPERDEHYERYLREREAMQQQQSSPQRSSAAHHGANGVNGHAASGNGVNHGFAPNDSVTSDDQSRRDAVDDLLKSLGQSRSS